MHRLLGAAGCEAAAVGNAVWLRYGPQAVTAEAAAAPYPLLCANLKPIDGVLDAVLIDAVGFVGVTDTFARFPREFDFGVDAVPIVETVKAVAARLRREGAELVVLLSHMGLDPRYGEETDDVLARELAGDVDLILGAHSHHVLEEGLRVGGVLIAQAGSHAAWLGRVEVDVAKCSATLIPVTEDLPAHPPGARRGGPGRAGARRVPGRDDRRSRPAAAAGAAAPPRPVGGLPHRREPGRRRADRRATAVAARPRDAGVGGRDPASAAWPRARKAARRRGGAIDPARTYRVGATDVELGSFGELVDPDGQLAVRYDFPTIVREAIEEDLLDRRR